MGREGFDGFGYFAPEFCDGAGGGFAQGGLELGEDLLDGIEVRVVGREIVQYGAVKLDCLADA